MSECVFVCPPIAPLLQQLRGRTVVLNVPEAAELTDAAALAKACGCRLLCVQLRSGGTLAALEPHDQWQSLPLAVHVQSVGPMRELQPRLAALRRLNVRVYVPASPTGNLTGVRLLSSLGIAATVVFDTPVLDWELLADLCTYALLGRTSHAPIEPFATVAMRYRPDAENSFGDLYFDEPGRFVHVDRDGHTAHSAADLAAGRYAAPTLGAYLKTEEGLCPPDAACALLAAAGACATCAAFSLCRGAVARQGACREGAPAFFAEFADTVEQHRRTVARAGSPLWQT